MKLLLFFGMLAAYTYAQHPSPCPEVFQYTSQTQNGSWSGQLTLNSEFPLSGVWIRLLLDRKVDNVETPFGKSLPREDKSFLIKDRSYNLVPGTPLTVPVTARWAAGPPASVVGVRLNARAVCPGRAAPLASQCPGVFAHEQDKREPGRWHGVLSLHSEFQLQGVWLRLVLDRPAELLGNEFGEVKTEDNLSYLIHNRNFTLEAGRPLKLSFWVKFEPSSPEPQIKTVRLNGRTICGQIISEDNNQNIIHYFPIFDKFGAQIPFLPQRHQEKVITTTQRTKIPIFPPFNPFSPTTLSPPLTTVSTVTTTVSIATTPSTTVLTTNTQSENSITSGGSSSANETPGTVFVQSATANQSEDTSGNQFISCGTVQLEKIDLITFGEVAKSAQWPWHGAIYLRTDTALDYKCGASLITELHALTAAHCVVESISTKKVRDPKSLVLFFGLLNRTDFSASSVQSPLIESIIVHKDYKVSENDIAVLKFTNKVKFNEFVRPVCLWEGDTDQRVIVNQTGTVVGFGVTQTGSVSEELNYANILVVDTTTCIFSHRDFYSKYTSPSTFCAGNLTQSAVCNGDSGGAMVFRRDGSDVWQVRGVVSTAVRNVDTGLCDYNYYAIFTDAAKFTDWIEMATLR